MVLCPYRRSFSFENLYKDDVVLLLTSRVLYRSGRRLPPLSRVCSLPTVTCPDPSLVLPGCPAPLRLDVWSAILPSGVPHRRRLRRRNEAEGDRRGRTHVTLTGESNKGVDVLPSLTFQTRSSLQTLLLYTHIFKIIICVTVHLRNRSGASTSYEHSTCVGDLSFPSTFFTLPNWWVAGGVPFVRFRAEGGPGLWYLRLLFW